MFTLVPLAVSSGCMLLKMSWRLSVITLLHTTAELKRYRRVRREHEMENPIHICLDPNPTEIVFSLLKKPYS
jgi:hypothetical protein